MSVCTVEVGEGGDSALQGLKRWDHKVGFEHALTDSDIMIDEEQLGVFRLSGLKPDEVGEVDGETERSLVPLEVRQGLEEGGKL